MHTRGRLGRVVRMRGFVGTIHAHAGQTEDHLWSGVFGGGNHPYARGADSLDIRSTASRVEPSIRTRGRRILLMRVVIVIGTIHTHAGQTFMNPS